MYQLQYPCLLPEYAFMTIVQQGIYLSSVVERGTNPP
jgi:hypothetical protein